MLPTASGSMLVWFHVGLISWEMLSYRLLLLVYLLYIGTFTLCCMHRPLKDIPENYTKAHNDPTIMIQKTLKVHAFAVVWGT